MSTDLRQSIQENIDSLNEIQRTVLSSGLDFSFDQEQISFQLEGLILELKEAIEDAIKYSGD